MPPVLRIVVAVADFDLRDFAREVLEQAGHRVLTASTREAGLYALARTDPPPIAVVEALRPLLVGEDAPGLVLVPVATERRYGIDEAGRILQAVADAVRRVA